MVAFKVVDYSRGIPTSFVCSQIYAPNIEYRTGPYFCWRTMHEACEDAPSAFISACITVVRIYAAEVVPIEPRQPRYFPIPLFGTRFHSLIERWRELVYDGAIDAADELLIGSGLFWERYDGIVLVRSLKLVEPLVELRRNKDGEIERFVFAKLAAEVSDDGGKVVDNI